MTQYGRVKPDCMLLKSSITQVSHTTRAITPDTAATRAPMRSASSIRLISFTGCRTLQLTMGRGLAGCGAALMALLVLAPLQAAPLVDCPPPLREQIDGLYRWQLQRQEQPGSVVIATQRQRFTPQLYRLLERADALTPADGRFVDFDLFSGTQVSTFSAAVLGCEPAKAEAVVALVAVQAGLPGRTAEPPQQLRYVLSPDGAAGWRIADIIYASEPPFRLSTFLKNLLEGL